MSSLWQVARLNARVAGLALRGRWMTSAHVASGYDAAAATYQQAWEGQLRPVTDNLLRRLLAQGLNPGRILDLGAGTGYSASRLATEYPRAQVDAVDISAGMLRVAALNAPPNLHCKQAEMLEFLTNVPHASVGLIVSMWALGYANQAKVFQQCARVLEPDGTLAFVVNYADTLQPVFRAFRRCMFKFPECVRLAAWPRFPKRWHALRKVLEGSGFSIVYHSDGVHPVEPPEGEMLPWLRQTGILSGFDQVLDLESKPNPAAYMESLLRRNRSPITHHYCMCIVRIRAK